jgi:hypothetical protein
MCAAARRAQWLPALGQNAITRPLDSRNLAATTTFFICPLKPKRSGLCLRRLELEPCEPVATTEENVPEMAAQFAALPWRYVDGVGVLFLLVTSRVQQALAAAEGLANQGQGRHKLSLPRGFGRSGRQRQGAP